jgi:hypothetical protein
VENIEIFRKFWMDMSVPAREEILQRALSRFKKPWKGPPIGEMANTSDIGNLPAVFSLSFLMPLMIAQTLL